MLQWPKKLGPGRLSKLTDEEAKEADACHPRRGYKGFARFCSRHVYIEDKERGGSCLLKFWPGQERIAKDLVQRIWIIGLKGRQLGLTWLIIAYILWRCLYSRSCLVAIINQKKEYAYDNIDRARYMYDRLPGWAQTPLTVNNRGELRFGERTQIRSLVGGSGAARSFTGDICFFDEASRVPDLSKTLGAVGPALTRSEVRSNDGQIIHATTSEGPAGDFAELWDRTYGLQGELLDENGVGPSRYKPAFISWDERPGRDQNFYAARKAELDAISPVLILQEYPRTIEEAFTHAAGRVYPLFARDRNIGTMKIPDHAQRFRAIDWGETKSAFVVLWIATMDGPPGLLIHPDCMNTIREFLAYRLDEETGRPAKGKDHTCDAVRYAVTTHDLGGLVYVYRELYRLDSVVTGWSYMSEIEEIHEMSGWERSPAGSKRPYRPTLRGERYELQSVADRSLGKAIITFNEQEIPCIPHKRLKAPKSKLGTPVDSRDDEKIEGIKRVAALIQGTADIEKYYSVTRQEQALRIYRDLLKGKTKVSRSLRERQLLHLAREILGHKGR